MLSRRMSAMALAVAGVAAAQTSHALTFNFINDGSVSSAAYADFQKAGQTWSNIFTNNMTVNIDVSMAHLGSNVLGQTGSNYYATTYSSFRNAITANAQTANAIAAASHLQSGNTLQFYQNNVATGGVFLNNNSNNINNFMEATRANAKALGLVAGNDSGVDATMQFSLDFPFQFDRTGGPNVSQYDFQSVITHELGHALGFVSSTDDLDYYAGTGAFTETNFEKYAWVDPLDLFRYKSNTNGVEDISYSGSSYLSIDGGATAISGMVNGSMKTGMLSTGTYHGDGWQASHWKFNLNTNDKIGIMDPVINNGSFEDPGALDIEALNIIGYQTNAVPEPISMMVLGAGALGLIRRRTKK